MKQAFLFGFLIISPLLFPGLNAPTFIPEWPFLLISPDPDSSGYILTGILLLLLLLGSAIYARLIWKRWKAGQQERVKQEQHIRQLQAQHKEMERQADQKNFLFSGLSHMLRETLDRLVRHTGALQDESAGSGQKGELQLSIKEGKQLLELLMEDIQELSKQEHPQFHIHQDALDLNQFLKELKSFALREKEEQNRQELRIHFSETELGEAFKIQADPQRMKQILYILIRHAIHYTHHGRIDISYQVQDGSLQFIIEDNGLGFTASEYLDLFHFFRRDAKMMSRTPAEKHMGLILAGEILHHMKGQIHAESKEQGGTRFTLKLPFSSLPGAGDKREDNQDREQGKVYDWSGKTILVVEDSKMAYELIHKMFSYSGANFELEPDGIKAVERCKSDGSIDLVLMDIQLPLMDGYKATREIKKIRPNLPIIAQTANALAGDRKKAREAGCDEYIAKPIDIDEMGEKIDQFIHYHQ